MVYPPAPAFSGLLVRDHYYRRPCFVWVVEFACSRYFSGRHLSCPVKSSRVSSVRNGARGALFLKMGHATSPASCTNVPRVQRATRASRRYECFLKIVYSVACMHARALCAVVDSFASTQHRQPPAGTLGRNNSEHWRYAPLDLTCLTLLRSARCRCCSSYLPPLTAVTRTSVCRRHSEVGMQ